MGKLTKRVENENAYLSYRIKMQKKPWDSIDESAYKWYIISNLKMFRPTAVILI